MMAMTGMGLGIDATNALVIGQAVLSFALPFPMIALVMFTRHTRIMGRFANDTILVLSLNALLVPQTFGVAMPGLPRAS
jgi:manganese transport protein